VVVSNILGSANSGVARLIVVNGSTPPPSPISLARPDSTHLSLSWSNGSGILLASPSLTLPLTNWTPVVTNPTMPYVITISNNPPQMFFRAQ
jgi:hypothetical protein